MRRRSILVTGCASGIGRDAALTLAARGWRVFATVRREADRAALATPPTVSTRDTDTGGSVEVLLMDYTDPASIAAAAEAVLTATGGTLDALFNNGAHALPGAVEDLPVDGLRAVFEANFFGWHDLTRRLITAMRAQGHGRIVQCSSVLGLVAAPWRGAYVASKFALEGLTDTLRLEMRGTGIHVVSILPGPIATRLRANSVPHFERWVNWRASPRAPQYEATLLRRLYGHPGRDAFERPPAAVTAVLLRALQARHPRPRYFVTLPTHVAGAARRLLPARLLERLLAGR